jgi:hypothetical protein
MLMDAVFGPQFFLNEIIWKRYGAHNDQGQGSRHFGRVHDSILIFRMSDRQKWNQGYTPLDEGYIQSTYSHVEAETGRRFTTTPLTGPGGVRKGNPVFEWKGHTRAWRYSRETMERLDNEGRLHYSKTGYVRQKLYLDESKGVPVQDLWSDISSLSGAHSERLGYQTQKPEALLERIIKASSNEGDVVLDPFCGCGTAISVAQRLNRRWIGIDITHLAIGLIKKRLADAFGDAVRSTYEVIGEPVDLTGAQRLAQDDPYQFQWWALSLVGARPTEEKKGADRGIDGRLYFHDENKRDRKTKQIIFSVKAGHVQSAYVRDLRGVIDREDAQIGVLICMEAPTKPMLKEAAEAGFYKPPGLEDRYPRIQILTIEELLAGKGVAYPRLLEVTFKKAPKARRAAEEQMALGGSEIDEPF